MYNLLRRIKKHDQGFTLIELLVVMIIIGILAAVAIPIFLNQQKTARDTQTVSAVKNMSSIVQTELIRYPDAAWYASGTTANGFLVQVGPDWANRGEINFSPANKGTFMRIEPVPGGGYRIFAYNPNGKVYNSVASVLVYDSTAGGIQKVTVDKTGSSFGEAQ